MSQPDVAIVGLSGRFPGAHGIEDFWRNLCAGTDCVSRFAEEELEDDFAPEVRARPQFVKARAFLEGADLFDAGFFGMHAREAELTDPQHRVFLECCWEALEDAGCDPGRYPGAIGVFAGCSINTYFLRNVLSDRSVVERFTSDYQVGSYPLLVGAGHDFLATRVAYKLDLRGPAMTLQSACSTSLLAVVQAAQALMLRQADVMLAGAVSITFPQKRGYLYQEGSIVSSDGRCRAFDASADGTVFGSGGGVAVLKRLDDAIADGDSIYAVIRGFGVNNDGAAKVGYTAPSVQGQADAIAAAHAMSGVDVRTIAYVECHGTGTPLGDPIEIAALTKAFRRSTQDVGFCALGSVKTNVGHLDVAAGMTGLVKTALALQRGRIPPTLHFTTPNPRIDFASSPFFVSEVLTEWPRNGSPRRAGLSAFGMGGTNVHLVLEEAPAVPPAIATTEPQLLVLSARTETALENARMRLLAHLKDHPRDNLADVAWTLQSGRRAFAHRYACTASTAAEAERELQHARGPGGKGGVAREAPSIAFMFPGQGAQYVNMGRELYERLPVFRGEVDRCAELLRPRLRCDIREALYPATEVAASEKSLTDTALAQPAIFCVEYALAQVWMRWGIAPAALAGHSVGEFVAATLAGVWSLEDALHVVAERGRLISALPRGAMSAVRMPERELMQILQPPLSLAAVNGPSLAVVSGPFDAMARFEALLQERAVTCRRLETSHAFHSSMMEPALAPLCDVIAGLRLSPPAVPYVSCVTGEMMRAADATAPEYWARHCREPVRFASALTALRNMGIDTFIEVGPGSTLATLARGLAKDAVITGSLPGAWRECGDLECMLESLGRLWVAGTTPVWEALHESSARRHVPLPAYPFERSRYWIDVTENGTMKQPIALAAPPAVPVASNGTQGAHVQTQVIALLEEMSGEDLTAANVQDTFLELGFDSLFLGRFVQQLQARFGIEVTFRRLLSDLPSPAALSDFIADAMPASAPVIAASSAHEAPDTPPQSQIAAPAPAQAAAATVIEAVCREQLQTMQQLMREQLQALSGVQPSSSFKEAPAVAGSSASAPQTSAAESSPERPSRFEPFVSAAASARDDLTEVQRRHIEQLVARTTALTARSKEFAQRARAVLADPRVAAGFRSEWKEMVYPIVCARSKGSHLWDIDGNEYVDLLNGFGQTAFGHAPNFVVEAIAEQLSRGFAIGPQTDLAGDVATLFCELTGHERMTFCNTGSEAVMAALRVARTVTGRDRAVMFNGSYHGQFDEVLAKGMRTQGRSAPVAPGIPNQSVGNMSVLKYGVSESLDWIREHGSELAAVLVEPVQSRHPELRPQAFLEELRALTQRTGTALVFDEVVTGFRVHPGGMQAIFGIRGDLATYGKVVGGGMPIGILAGKARFMDALDGGMWQYGDDSFPEVAPTFFAGTFVRHPLTMAAVLAVLRHVRDSGPQLQESLNARTTALVQRLNAELERRGIHSRIEHYGSLMYFDFSAEERLAGLLYYHMRARGVYVQESFPCFLTTEHTDEDLSRVVEAFAESLDDLQSAGIFTANAAVPRKATPLEVPLTEEQTEIWLAAQLGDDASRAFNESVTLRLDGAFDEAAFAAAWDSVVARHDALRACFERTGEAMRITGDARLSYTIEELADAANAETVLRALVDAEARTPFDLVNGPLIRGRLLRLSADAHAFILTAHHIVCDGWSMNVVLNEFAACYDAYRRGQSPQLPQPMAFSSYARAAAGRDPAELARVESFWLSQFANPPSPLALPTDRPRPALKTYNGATQSLRLDADEYRAIRKAGAGHGCTLFVVLLSAFQALVGRLAGDEDVVVGIPAAGQALLGDEILVGHCVDFLPIRTSWNGETSLAALLQQVKRRVLDAYEHQRYTLGTLVRKLALAREPNRLPLAEIQFNLERLSDGMETGGLSIGVTPNPKAYVNFDVFLNVVESDEGLRIDCDYNTDLFDAATIERWLRHYRAMLQAIVRDAAVPVSAVAYAGPEETAPLPCANSNVHDYPRHASIHALFEKRAASAPDAVAVVCEETALTYGELNRRANRLARHLRSRVGSDAALIGVCVDRSVELLVALLATLKAGCAYVPLDPAHPRARNERILEQAGVAAVIVDGSRPAAALESARLIDLVAERARIEAEPAVDLHGPVPSDALAYVIYTSGSTGAPKGVEVEHRSVVNLLCAMAREPALASSDVLLSVTTVSFDIAALELFLPLVTGASVVIAQSEETFDGFRLLERLQSCGATVMQATPATWRLLLEAGFRANDGFKMLCGGEALQRGLADRLLEGGGELWNMYGPTETTIWSSCKRILPGQEITVGGPIANTQFYVLDAGDQPVAPGRPGHLHIAGDGVARGYLARPELTAERFVANPFGTGRMYRSGDLARFLPDGEVQIIGRIDAQIKLRGFRIEPAEVEEHIVKHPAVAAAAVALRPDAGAEERLVGYYVTRDGSALLPDALQRWLAESLPAYMIPASWMHLEALPLSSSGKIDRGALPAPAMTAATSAGAAPVTEMEIALAKAWCEVLHREAVGADDDIFALGADSIQLFQITARVNKQGIPLMAKQLIQYRTIGRLAAHLESAKPAPLASRHGTNGSARRFPPAAFEERDVSANAEAS